MNVANSPDSKSQPPIEKYNVGILLFDGVEVLDFAGPFEVFRERGSFRTWNRADQTRLPLSESLQWRGRASPLQPPAICN